MDEIELKTAPADFRFPTTNQTRHCFTRYIEFHRLVDIFTVVFGPPFPLFLVVTNLHEWKLKFVLVGYETGNGYTGYVVTIDPIMYACVAAKGEESDDCGKFAKYYRSLCPGEWIDKWNEQRENGTFPGPL